MKYITRFDKNINFEAVLNEENKQREIESDEIEIQDDQVSERINCFCVEV